MKTLMGESGTAFAREAVIGYRRVTITHRNPSTGEYWAEDVWNPRTKKYDGDWVRPEYVKFI